MKTDRTPLSLALLAALVLPGAGFLAGCRHTDEEGPETAPVGPSVLSEAAIQEALHGPVDFRRHVAPLFAQNCLPCHDGKQMPQFVNLTSRSSTFARGPYGYRIVPGKPDQSLVIGNLSLTHAPVKSMPPVGSRMTPEETKILRNWITEGAEWP
jgi:Planctomycete cytochrome C